MAVLTSLAAVACAGEPVASETRENPAWMVGKWAWLSLDEKNGWEGNCDADVEFYRRDGYVVDGQSSARWRIEGNTLGRVMIGEEYGENVDGKVYRSRFTRIAPDQLLFKGDDTTQKMVRCGDVPGEWDTYPVK